MKLRDGRRAKKAETVDVQRISLLARSASWVILKLLSLSLLTVIAGIGFCGWKYFLQDSAAPRMPDPFTPAAVYASPVPPIDYRQHPPPAGLTAPMPVLAPYLPPPPLPRMPVTAHALPHAAHRPSHPAQPH
jgi:hypothetical protein